MYVEIDATASSNLIAYLHGFTITLFGILSIIICLLVFNIFISLFNRKI